VTHDREVVGDDQVGQPQALLELAEQVEHLRLDRHVERGHRLVRDHQRRLEGDCACDTDALALAAGELVGVAAGGVARQADQLEQLRDASGAVVGDAVCLPAARSGWSPRPDAGLRLAIGSWNTICMCRRILRIGSGASDATSVPSKNTWP
jgi:hypothetical protein